jgi:two-component system LytT family response regulator
MIKAVHIEDEPRNIELLEGLIKTHCSGIVMLVGNARSVRDAAKLIRDSKPQLIFLDIELNQGNAFELLEEIKEQSFEVIFITAYNEYAVKAFRMNAVDYLLKPISIVELKEATAKAVHRITQATPANENLFNALKQIKADFGVQKIGLPVSDGLLFINSEEIIRINAKGSYSVIYLLNGKTITCPKNLKFLEQMLPAANFLRVHHSWIINLKYLKKYYRGKNGHMEMEDGSTVTVSIRKKGNFLNQLPE